MRILFLAQVLPYPLDAGPKTRAYYVLRYLAQHHRVTLLAFTRPTDPPAAMAHLARFCEEVQGVPMRRSTLRNVRDLARSLLGRWPFMVRRDWIPEMVRQVDRQVQSGEYDAVHADQLWMAPYALRGQAISQRIHGKSLRTVLDQHNAVFQIPMRLAHHQPNPLLRGLLHLEATKLQRFERQVCGQFDRVVWVTREDRDALVERTGYPGSGDPVIPICVEPEEGALRDHVERPFRVTFLGGMHWPPNAEGIQWFADRVWPELHQAFPQVRLTVIGKEPPARLRAQAQDPERRIEVLGYVEDPTPYLAETAVFIVPLHAGGGMRVKILDAWRWKLPVVSTSIGAEGIDVRPGENILLGDSPQAFSRHVRALLADPGRARAMVEEAHATLRRAYHWRRRYRAWDIVYS